MSTTWDLWICNHSFHPPTSNRPTESFHIPIQSIHFFCCKIYGCAMQRELETIHALHKHWHCGWRRHLNATPNLAIERIEIIHKIHSQRGGAVSCGACIRNAKQLALIIALNSKADSAAAVAAAVVATESTGNAVDYYENEIIEYSISVCESSFATWKQ